AFPVLRALDEARRVLTGVMEGRESVEHARATLQRALPRAAWVDAILPARTAAASATSEKPRTEPSAPKGSSSLDALFDKVEMSAPAKPPSPSSILAAVVGGASSRGSSPSVGTSARSVEAALVQLIGSILRHPAIRSLERAFRGLKLLVDRTDPRSGVEVDLIACAPDEIAAALRRLIERSGAEGLRAPVDLIVIAARVNDTPRDLEQLSAWAELASVLRAPLVVSGSPRFLGFDSVEALSRSSRKINMESAGLRGLAAREESRFVVLALNELLVRPAYEPSSARLRGLELREDAKEAVFAAPGIAIAILSAQSFVRTKFGSSILGPRHGLVPDLPVRELTQDGQSYALCLEALVAIDTQNQVGDAGFALLGCAPNQDSAVLLRAPTLHRGEDAAKLGRPVQETPLGDQLFATRVSQAVEQIAAAIPRGTDRQVAEQVAVMTLTALFDASGRGPETLATIEGNRLVVTLRPHGHAGVTFEEVTLAAALS
ncbi:MAG: type VI secretion system contractile sheath domain-containing protein, partial [Polyangiales bacterium]